MKELVSVPIEYQHDIAIPDEGLIEQLSYGKDAVLTSNEWGLVFERQYVNFFLFLFEGRIVKKDQKFLPFYLDGIEGLVKYLQPYALQVHTKDIEYELCFDWSIV